MEARKVAGVFYVAVGIMMAGVWAVLFGLGQVPEVESAPVELGFLLVAEFLTAGSAMFSGLGLLLHKGWAYRAYLVATGLLLYSITNYLGGLIQQGDIVMAALIGLMGVLTVAFFVVTLPKEGSRPMAVTATRAP